MNEGLAQAARARRVQALARRAETLEGTARQRVLARLQMLQAAVPEPPAAAAPPPATASPLAALLAELARARGAVAGAAPGAPLELRAVREHRSTWSRLSVEQRIHQALAQVPAQAGPLNTQRLVHQVLHTLRELSPAYLHRMVAQVETLLWLEQLAHGGAAPEKARRRP